MKTRFVSGLAGAAALALALTACGGTSPAPGASGTKATGPDYAGTASGEVKTMGFNPSDEVGKSRSDLAKTKLSGVTVTMDTANFDPQKFAALSAAGNLPDIVQMDRSLIATYAQKGLIQPLDQCFTAQKVDAKTYWYPAVMADVTYKGNVYAAPQFFQPGMFIVNKRVASAVGVTAADIDSSKPDALLAAAKKLVKLNGTKPTLIGLDPDVPGSAANWFYAFGGSVSDADGAPTLDKAENIAALTWLKSLIDAQGGYAEFQSFKQTWDVFGNGNQFVKDQQGVGLWAQWYINVLANTKDQVQLDAAPMKDKTGKAFGMAGGSALAIPTKAKNPVAACQWLTTVTSLDAWKAAGDARAQTVIKSNSINTGLFTGSPVADKAVKDAHVKPSGSADFDKLIQVSYDVLANTQTQGMSPVGQQIKDALTNAVTSALNGSKSPEQALKDAQTAVKPEYDKVK